MLNKIIRFFLENRLVTFLMLLIFIGWGIVSAPFDWETGIFPSDPVPVDAIPDIGENQQIVYTEWPGRSPQDIEDQISYPLTTSLLGIPGIKTIRSNSIFGVSSIYIIFDDDVEFYWSRTRILEKLNSLPSGTLPEDVNPHWVRMPLHWDKYTGTPLKAVIKMETRQEAGIRMNYAPFRIFMFAIP